MYPNNTLFVEFPFFTVYFDDRNTSSEMRSVVSHDLPSMPHV